jgi:hypothetical protein
MAMIPKEKAEELVRKYYSFGLNNPAQSFSWYECKQCASIAVDEIIEALEEHQWQNRHVIEDYKLVKQEIELL